MKPYLLPLTVLLLVGCSSGATDGGTSTLQPLPTTGIPVIDTIPITDRPFTDEQLAFVDDVYFLYGSYPLMNAGELVQMGELWCQLMTDGMSVGDVIGRINEGAIDNDDAKLHYSIIQSGGENLCKDQFAKAGSIALRYLTP